MKYEDEHDARKASIEDDLNARAEEAAEQKAKQTCACASMDAYECARIRDKITDPFDEDSDDDSHRRACECECHKDEYPDDEDL